MKNKIILLTSLLLLSGACYSYADFDAGPLFAESTGPNGEIHYTAAGPFFERVSATNGASEVSFRPFFSLTVDPMSGRRSLEILYPLGRWRRFDEMSSWRCLNIFGQDYDVNEKGLYRVQAFPFVFFGRDAAGENYACLFPLWGDIHEMLGRDLIKVRLFPLYLYHSLKDAETRSYLFPFISYTKSEDVSRLRVFPLYSRAEDRKHGVVNKFIMWPVWTSVRSTNPGSRDGGFMLFPLYGQGRNADKKIYMFLPPLFRFESQGQNTSINCPWPFFRYKSGEEQQLYLWPLWGRRIRDNIDTSFILFPIMSRESITRKYQKVERTRFFPFFHLYDKKPTLECLGLSESARDKYRTERFIKIWPVYSRFKRGDASVIRVLDLWPGRTPSVIERNMAPFWTIYSRKAEDDYSESRLLWGMLSRKHMGEKSSFSLFPVFDTESSGEEIHEWSILKGLFSRRREGLRKSYRLLYFLKIGNRAEKDHSDAD